MPGLDWGTIFMQYARAIGWSITAAVGFAFGIGIALKVFDMLSTDIDEWEEIKKRKFRRFFNFYFFDYHGWFTCT